MTMVVADRTKPTVTELVVEEEIAPGNKVSVLQRFPVTVVPHLGDHVQTEDSMSLFAVTNVMHGFSTRNGNRHTVFITIKKIR